MRPKRPAQSTTPDDLFRSELKQMIDSQHELVILSERIPWEQLEMTFGTYYMENQGSPGKPICLMAGLQYLKYPLNLSDKELVARWVGNPLVSNTFAEISIFNTHSQSIPRA